MLHRPDHVAAAAAVLALFAGPSVAATPAAPPRGGTITIEQAVAAEPTARAAPVFVDAVSGALAAKGFTVLDDPGHSAYVAELTLTRTDVGTGSTKRRGGRGVVLPGASAGVGAGVIIPLSSRRAVTVSLTRIELELVIHKRGQGAVVWHGAAVTVRAVGASPDADALIASGLSEALLRDYPGEPQGVVSVP